MGIVRAGDRDGLRPDLVVEPHEGVSVAVDGTRVLGDPVSVLVLNNAQLEHVGMVQANVVVVVCVSIGWLCVVCGGVVLDGCGNLKWNLF